MATTKRPSRKRIPEVSRSVRVVLPAEAAYDLKLVNVALKDILGKLGCPACCSGHDIIFETERHFVFNPKTLKNELR